MGRKRGKARAGGSEPLKSVPARAPAPAWPPATWINLALLALVSVVLFREVFLHPSQMLWGNDIARLHSVFKTVQYRSWWEHGQFPLWDSTMLCGRSIVGDAPTAILNPLAWLFWVSDSSALFGVYLCLYVTFGAWGMFLWMRRLACAPAGAFVAAVAFALSGKSAGYVFAGHMDLLPGMMLTPWLLWAVERLLQRLSLGSAIVLGAVASLLVTTGHPPSVYWNSLIAAGYLAVRLAHLGIGQGWARVRRPLGLAALAGGVFLVGAMAWWFPVLRQTLLLSARAADAGGDFEFATMASAAPSDLLRVLWPFHGLHLPVPFASDPENRFFWETASYPGLVALALAGYFIISAPRDRRVLAFGLAAALMLLLALGDNTPLYRVFYDVVPGVSMVRAPGRLLVYSNLFVAGLAGFGASALLAPEGREPLRFLAVAAVLVVVAFSVSPPTDAASSASLIGSHALAIMVTIALLLVGLGLAFADLPSRTLAALLVGIALLDLGVVWSVHVFTAPVPRITPDSSVAEFLKARRAEGPFRYFDPTETVPQELAARHGLETITGYNPAIYRHQLEAYRGLWPEGEQSGLVQLFMHSPNDIRCTQLLDLMNVRYVVAYETALDARFRKVFTTPAGEFEHPRSVFERVDPLPRAFVVGSSVQARTEVDALQAVRELNPREACILQADPVEGGAAFQPASITAWKPGEIRLDFTTGAPGVLVVSEGWHPDWVASDNGEPVAVRRADYAILGIPVAADAHSVRVWYRPWDFYLGCAVSGVFWLIVGGAAVAQTFRQRAARHAEAQLSLLVDRSVPGRARPVA